MTTPPYIPVTLVEALPLAHDWDDWNPFRVLKKPDAALAERFARVSDRARVAFTIGCAEWVLCRFGGLHVDPRPANYLEAQWARLIDVGFGQLLEAVLDDDDGPIRGPLSLALATVTNAFRAVEKGGGTDEPPFASALARHVLGELPEFGTWQAAVIERLERHYQRTGKDPLGPPVCREVLDPGVELTEKRETQLIRRFLRTLDAGKNPYLVPSRH